MLKNVLTSYEVAQVCHVTMTTVANWIKDGSLKAFKTKGGHRRIRREDLEAFARHYTIPLDSKPRALVVDDDVSIQTGLKRLFESSGFSVDVAQNGFEAGVQVQKQKPDVMILDLLMPELDGFEVIEYIKSKQEFKDIKIVVLTGYPSQDNIDRAQHIGADVCLAKPVESSAILKIVEKTLGYAYVPS